jgi:hypothetical protein
MSNIVRSESSGGYGGRREAEKADDDDLPSARMAAVRFMKRTIDNRR